MDQDKKAAVDAAAPPEGATASPSRHSAKGPHWQASLPPRGEQPKKPPRDYLGPAIAALTDIPATARNPVNTQLIAALIIAQALDRFGEKLIDAAAVSQYRRSS